VQGLKAITMKGKMMATAVLKAKKKFSELLWKPAVEWTCQYEGSTRSSALLRIGIVFLIWSRWAAEVIPFRNFSLSGVILSVFCSQLAPIHPNHNFTLSVSLQTNLDQSWNLARDILGGEASFISSQ